MQFTLHVPLDQPIKKKDTHTDKKKRNNQGTVIFPYIIKANPIGRTAAFQARSEESFPNKKKQKKNKKKRKIEKKEAGRHVPRKGVEFVAAPLPNIQILF